MKTVRFYAGGLVLSVVLACALTACSATPEAKRQVLVSEAAALRMNQLVKDGKTSRDQEQAYIQANAQNWSAFKHALVGSK